MKIACIIGTRPNFIKFAILSKELQKNSELTVIHTGQHYDYELNNIFFKELNIANPDYHLNVGSGEHGYQTGEMLKGIESALLYEDPDMVVVFGDSNSTLAGALAAAKLHIKVSHIEAGLRSFNKMMPEEINRILVDHCSNLLFCPTKNTVDNLMREGIDAGVYLVGDVMVDAQLYYGPIAENKSQILKELGLEPKGYYLATIQRASNTNDIMRLGAIAEALNKINNVIFVCHPRTEKYLKRAGLWKDLNCKIKVLPSVGFLDMLTLEKNSKKILTDSNGVQKEAYLFGIPSIILREKIEFMEIVKEGWSVLAGANKMKIINLAATFEPHIDKPREIFGNGDACMKIATKIVEN